MPNNKNKTRKEMLIILFNHLIKINKLSLKEVYKKLHHLKTLIK